MKTLVLVRHAMADETDPLLDDCVRPLSTVGEKAAASLADQLTELGLKVDVLLSSHADCARSTADVIASKLSLEVRIDRRLYDAGVMDVLEASRSLEYHQNTAVLIGHNPSLSEFARYITAAKREDISHGSAVVVELAVNTWRQVFVGKGLFRTQLVPAVEALEEVVEEIPPPPMGWKDRLCHWLDLKTDDDDDDTKKKP